MKKKHIRLALPPLAGLTERSEVSFVAVDRDGGVLRSGALPLEGLAAERASGPVWAILAPGDAVCADVSLPPLTGRRLEAAVASSVEPMTLSDVDELCVGFGPRGADGKAPVAWASRRDVAALWQRLGRLGLDVGGIVPHEIALAPDDPHPREPLRLPAGPRWLAPLPGWSLARDELRPAGQLRHWRKPLIWAAVAAAVWVLGLQIQAAGMRREMRALQTQIETAVRQAFPAIPVIIDPVRQAQQQRDALRLAQGVAREDDFIPMAAAAARVMPFTDKHVRAMKYEAGHLTLTLDDSAQAPANISAMQQAASVQSLLLEKDKTATDVWHVRRASAVLNAEGAKR
jgi:general secretion pathway protein L